VIGRANSALVNEATVAVLPASGAEATRQQSAASIEGRSEHGIGSPAASSAAWQCSSVIGCPSTMAGLAFAAWCDCAMPTIPPISAMLHRSAAQTPQKAAPSEALRSRTMREAERDRTDIASKVADFGGKCNRWVALCIGNVQALAAPPT
jgi:hypothetical protein